MSVVEILLLFIVGVSAVVCLILEILEDQSKAKPGFHFVESVKASDGDDSQEEKELISDDLVIEEIKETAENQGRESSEEEISGLLGISGNSKDDIEISDGGDFDDWEGIERTELEKIFGEGVVFLSDQSNADKIDEDLKLELYGLQKVAFEGACHESQPMALKLSARAKWNAWEKLGNMSPEMAMEKYVNILSKAIPGWKGGEGNERAIKDASYQD